jgi:hypothetical protein
MGLIFTFRKFHMAGVLRSGATARMTRNRTGASGRTMRPKRILRTKGGVGGADVNSSSRWRSNSSGSSSVGDVFGDAGGAALSSYAGGDATLSCSSVRPWSSVALAAWLGGATGVFREFVACICAHI